MDEEIVSGKARIIWQNMGCPPALPVGIVEQFVRQDEKTAIERSAAYLAEYHAGVLPAKKKWGGVARINKVEG